MDANERELEEWEKAFESWYEDHFQNQQGEDSPYRHEDVKNAFWAGFINGEHQ